MPYPPSSAIANFFDNLFEIINSNPPHIEIHQPYNPTQPILQTHEINGIPEMLERPIEREKISRFFNDLTSLLADKNKTAAYEFNVFDYIDPNELTLSKIIADLLSPNGAHGQQNTFLIEFIEDIIKKAPQHMQAQENLIKLRDAIRSNISNIFIQTEATTIHGGRRMDIVINLGNNQGLVIENKPWANDQENALTDYANDARRRFPNGWMLIYLHGSGRIADEYTLTNREELINSGHYLDVGYTNFLSGWLRTCLHNHPIPEIIQFFLRNFISYIENQFENHQ